MLAHYRDDRSRLRTFCRCGGSSLDSDAGTSNHTTVGALHDPKPIPSFHIAATDRSACEYIGGQEPQLAPTSISRSGGHDGTAP